LDGRQDRRVQEPLQVERHVVPRAPQLAERGRQRPGAACVDGNSAIHDRHEIEQVAVADVNEPVDLRVRIRPAQRGRGGTAWMTSPSEPSRTMSSLFKKF
jgi:hypothetical protein